MEAGVHYAQQTATLVAERTTVRTVVRDYFEMAKPKVQTLLLLTTITTMYVAGSPSLELVFLTCLGGALSAGGAGAVNHWFDRDIDRLHDAHRQPAVASGRVSPRAALIYGVALAALSFLQLSLTVNVLAAFLALSGFLGYVLVYTVWLKRTTPQNIVIGGAAGAVPPLVGWAAVPAALFARRAAAVRDRLLLDPAPLLGPVAAHEGRVRARRRADAARSSRARPSPAARSCSTR